MDRHTKSLRRSASRGFFHYWSRSDRAKQSVEGNKFDFSDVYR